MKYLFLKRAMVFWVTFGLVIGIVTVDRECGMAYGRESTIGITLKKTDKETIDAMVLGKNYSINTREIKDQLAQMEKNWNNTMKKAGLL